MAISEQKKLILTNQISILMFLFIVIYISISIMFKLIALNISILVYVLSSSILVIPYMNSKGYYRLTSFNISVCFPVAVLIFSTVTKLKFHDNIDIIYYFIPRLLLLGSLVIPLILIDLKHKASLVTAVLINLIAVISYDYVTGLFGVGFGSLPVTVVKYNLINIFIFLPYLLILFGIIFLLSINLKYEKLVQVLLGTLKEKNEILENQKGQIEKIHLEITDSINYAQRIQTATLPDHKLLSLYFEDYFILFKPRNIVSGDFYWFSKIQDKLIFCLADCTGHGVPGAFMSLLGISFLREIVNNEQFSEPSEILNRLRNEVIGALNQKGVYTEQKDGMDISLFSLSLKSRENGDSISYEFKWAGANNPCWIIKNNKLEELLPDKMPVGIHEQMLKFKSVTVILNKGDKLYMSTDGYRDQFGGPSSKKFMSGHLKSLILENSTNSMSMQKKIFEQKIEEWRSGFGTVHEQTDDISLIGITI
jgi:serine phosphatase RsbU (regulator of sigma subunit)